MQVIRLLLLVGMAILSACTSRYIDQVDTSGLRNKGTESVTVDCYKDCVFLETNYTKVVMVSDNTREIFGKKTGHRKFYGLRSRNGWLLPPYYTDINVWRSDFAFVKRLGDKTYRMVNLDSKRETESSYQTMNGPYALVNGTADEGSIYVFIGDEGQPTRELGNVKSLSYARSFGKFDNDRYAFIGQYRSKDDAVIVRHQEQGFEYDVLYSSDLIPLTPPLRGIRVLHRSSEKNLFAVELDENEELFWPMYEDGTIPPQPENLVGIQHLVDISTPSEKKQLWGVKWETDNGIRWSVLTAPNAYRIKNNRVLEEVLASRSSAHYRDAKIVFNRITTYGNTWNKPYILSRIDGSEDYFVFDRGEHEPLEGEVYASEAVARKEYRDRTRRTLAREAEQRRQYWAKQKAIMDAWNNRKIVSTGSFETERSNRAWRVGQLIDDRKFNEAALAAREFGPEKIIRVVKAAVRIGRGAEISERDLRVAYATLPVQSPERQKIAPLIKRKENQRWRRQQTEKRQQTPAWRPTYRDNNFSAPKASGNQKSYAEIMKETKFNQTIRYIKGDSNWKYN